MESDPGLICILESAEGTEAGPGEDPAGASVSADTPAPVPKDSSREAVSFEVHSVVSRHPDAERFSMQSIWWIDPPARRTEGPQAVAIKLSEGVDVQWICAQGASTPWIEREGVVVLAVPTLEMPLRLDMWTRSSRADEIPAEIQGTRREGWILRENRAYAISGDAVANGSDVVREMCRRNLAGLAALQTLRSSRPANETEQAVLAGRGAWQRWTEFLSDDTVSMLLGMMANPDASRGEALDALEASYRDRGVPIAAERRGHVLQRADQWSEYLRGVADASAMDAPVRDGNVSPLGSWPMQQSRWVATILMGLLVVLAAWVWGAVGMGLGRTPWWPLILIGIWIWALTGTWLPALVLAFLASFLAVDSYRIVNERFRQTAIRGPR